MFRIASSAKFVAPVAKRNVPLVLNLTYKNTRGFFFNNGPSGKKFMQNMQFKFLHSPFGRKFSWLDHKLRNLKRHLYVYLIGANVAIWLAWTTGILPHSFLMNHFALSPWSMANHYYHTMITYSFSHINFFHLFVNMFTLFFFGRAMELQLGSKPLLSLYLLGAFVGALFIVSQGRSSGQQGLTIGASASTTAILSYYIMNNPFQTIFLYFIPVPAWVVGLLIFGQSMLFYNAGNGVSHSGHLGGLFAGVMYYFYRRGGFRM